MDKPGTVKRSVKTLSKQGKPPLSQKKVRVSALRVATLNVNTLRKKDAEVVETLSRRKVDICCVQETRLKGNGARKITGKNTTYKLFWEGNSSGQGGVGILLAERLIEDVADVKPISDRILLLKIVIGKQIFTIISLYAPQQRRPETEKDRFYDQLLDTVMAVPDNEVLIILGDWNGHVGAAADGYEDAHGGHGFGERNPEGVRILQFALANNLTVGNTQFIKRDTHLITYTSGDHRTQVDYILYRKNFRKAVTNVKVIPGEECAPQHHLLVCDFTVSAPPKAKRKFTPRQRTWKLLDPVVASEFHATFKSKVEESTPNSAATTPEEAWHNLKVPINESLEEVCGRSSKRQWRKKTWWWNEHVNAAVKEKTARFRAHVRKRGNTREARAALVAYHEAKRTARREIALTKSSAGEAMFREVDPNGSRSAGLPVRWSVETRT